MRKASALALLIALALPFTADRAEAQFSLRPYVGYNTDDALGFLIGIGGEFDAPFALGNLDLAIQPGIEYVFTDDGGSDLVDVSYLQIDVNLVARFGAPGASIAPYAGAGLGIGIVSVDVDIPGAGSASDSETELGLNLLGGVEFPGALGFGDPFVGARYSMIEDFDSFSILAGFRIPLGR